MRITVRSGRPAQSAQLRRAVLACVRASRSYTVLDTDSMKYWTMGASIAETILINRKVLTPSADPPATVTLGAV